MFLRFIKSVVGKIVLGYIMIITVALVSTFLSLYIINKNNISDKYTTEVLFPSVVKLKTAEKLCSDSYMLITR
jgi:CHASE3 domain sensor protein